GRGIRTVVDLRADSEVARDPSRLWSGVANFTSLPIAESAAEPVSLLDRILSGAITSMSESQMADVYITLLADNASQFARFATLAADVDNWPMLYHCTAGKDRTGLATALVLELCDVGREHVLDEYCATNEQHSYRRIEELRETLERAGVDLEAIRPLLMAPRPVLAGALAHLDDSYGGIEGFLVDAGGMGPTVPAEVRLNLVV
ncbi:MAG TPA: hypothetical protein DEP69_05640, partial [Acidimicrobiaceae bacterium]|nr:hypothetical protein [Acidimicrobiaceae bacterium]